MSTIALQNLDSETLVLPELAQFIGKDVEIESERSRSPMGTLIDHQFHAQCEAEEL